LIIQSLCKYYEILANDEECDIPKYGYSSTRVSAALVISKEGELVDIISLKVESEKGKKLVSKNMIIPEYTQPTSGVFANFLCGSSSYLLGIGDLKNPERSKKCFYEFQKKHNEVLGGQTSLLAKAVLLFLGKWNPVNAMDNAIIKSNEETLLEGGNIVLILDCEGYIHENSEIKEAWEKYKFQKKDDAVMQCLISGENEPIAELHLNKIKGVRNAQMAGASIVSFNAPSYESYGKKQSFNSPISRKAAFAYTTVLNYMLANPKQKIQIGDATTVFWAESPSSIYQMFAMQFLNPTEDDETDEIINDINVRKTIEDVLKSAKTGNKISENIYNGINPVTKFYILGLSPNASRISIRYFHRNTFSDFVEKVAMHYSDMEIAKERDGNRTNIPIWQLLRETVPPKSSDKDTQPLLAGAVMRSIISGEMYPQALYNSILQRIKADSEVRVNYIRASVIKACLLRKARIENENMKEVLTVALNEQIKDTPYLLGRLFAILEKTQKDAGNETIRARYFTSAMTTPGAVFPILLRLAQHHVSKVQYGFLNDKNIQNIMNDIESFPAHLSLDKQGVFVLGYYKQKVKLWEKPKNENSKEEN
jgi:CRISPR-associated protein Csd1